MTLSRILGAVGRTMIAAGLLILMFVAYQLWGTGLRTVQAQNALEDEFAARQAELQAQLEQATTTTTTSAPTTDPGVTSTTSPADADPLAARYASLIGPPAPGDPIGRITIPKIGSDFWYVEGVDLRWLQEGPGHFPGTPFPGQAGNAALAGHRTTYKAPFNRIDELSPGDLITVQTLQGTFTYEVLPQGEATPENPPSGHYIVSPTQTEILDQVEGENTLTLMACHPKYSAAQRIVVKAKLVENPAPPTPPSVEPTQDNREAMLGMGGEELIGGQPTARGPALFWGALAAAVWLVAWAVGKRWRRLRWPAYVVALPVFLVPLYFCFENINRLLPAGY
ncbi:MAG: sortase [Acidimicrobiales bacterium]|nr:sortase [Acidimicrobiales bacterium]